MFRRDFLATTSIATAAAVGWLPTTFEKAAPMYGLLGKMSALPGQRDALVKILLEGTGEMPGCLSYIVALDTTDANAIWITEAWDSKESHDASLMLPAVKSAIAKGRPLIAGFGDGTVTTPVGGHGLVPSRGAKR